MIATDSFLTISHFAHTRWMLGCRNRAELEARQAKELGHFMRDILPLAPRYRDYKGAELTSLPIMDKDIMMNDFAGGNTCGVELGQAMEIAVKAEKLRDFSPMLGDLTVGLSSGTSGNRGVFIVSKAERLRWAGILLARTVPSHLLARLLTPWQPPLRVAFFLRANSNLYTTLNSRRIDFAFYDLLDGIDTAISGLNAFRPDVVVGPPTLLRTLALEVCGGRLHIDPSHIISVAEVLEERDAQMIRETFGYTPHQIYQATEGFLGYTCEAGTIHLNESFLHIEPEWIDSAHTRFQPVITDFSRNTQLIVRYRLNDILKVHRDPCPCGRAEIAIEAVEGRTDEVLWLPSRAGGRAIAVFPEYIRRAMLLTGPVVSEYELIQSGMELSVKLKPCGGREEAERCVTEELNKLWAELGVEMPAITFSDWVPPQAGSKRRRVIRKKGLGGISCEF